MNSEKRWPQRMCIACRQMKDKRQLLRVVRSPEGGLHLDSGGKAPGRGAYLCAAPECLKRAKKAHSLEKALKTTISDECWQQIEQAVDAAQPEQVAPE